MPKTVTIQLQDGKELTYSNINRVEEDRYKIKVYAADGALLASLDRGDIKNLYTEEPN